MQRWRPGGDCNGWCGYEETNSSRVAHSDNDEGLAQVLEEEDVAMEPLGMRRYVMALASKFRGK